jgi:hypothetical protein
MPAGHQLVVSPTDPAFFVLETTFGLLASHDAGRTFAWICERSVGYGDGGVQDPSIGATPTSLLAGLREGLARSFDQGCAWDSALGAPVVDLVVRRDDPHTVLALTSKYAGISDAGQNLFATQVFSTHDDGKTWLPQGPAIDPAVEVQTIDVAPGDPQRVYIGGARNDPTPDGGALRVAVVLTSSDGGATYLAHTIPLLSPLETTNGAAFVSAVDPNHPDRVYVRIGYAVADRLLVSDDAGATFRTAYQGRGNLLGFALSTDGTKVFVGGPLDGVLAAAAYPTDAGPALAFAARFAGAVQCLSWIDGALYACTGEPSNPFRKELAISTDDGATFASLFHFACMAGPLACPGGAIDSACSPGLALLRASIGDCDADGGGADDAGSDAGGEGAVADAAAADAGAAPSGDAAGGDAAGGDAAGGDAASGSAPAGGPGANAGCGCRAGVWGSSGSIPLLLALVWLAWASARRRRVRRLGGGGA